MSTSSAASAGLSLYFWPRAVHASSPVAAALSITNPRPCNPFPAKPRRPYPNPNYHVVRSSSSSGSSSSEYNLEEQRWLREEQRWLREEQRWMREERRWNQERELLLQEIARLKLELGAVEYRARSIEDGEVVGLLKEEKLVIEESGVSVRPLVLEENKKPEEQPKKVEESWSTKEKKKKKKWSQALRMGAEGDEVKELQEALMRLGFFSGEEDMGYSSFSTRTDRAVKTWQASVGVKEDGVMTAELLEWLYFGKQVESSASGIDPIQKDGPNGAAVTSVTEVSEIRQTVVKESDSEVEVSQQRVFLLGENRWEEPRRLANSKSQKGSSRSTQCMACRGEGRLMCLECDGTGEPNIEPQFMEWVDGGTKCPYCEGLGYTICDVCDGKAMVR